MYDQNFFYPPAFPDFPMAKGDLLFRKHSELTATKISLCPADWSRDAQFLFGLYRSTRQNEIALMNWGKKEEHLFLTSQFMAQHIHYVSAFPDATYTIIKRDNVGIGRLYLHQNKDRLHLIEITVCPELRGHGIGSALLSTLTTAADKEKLTFTLMVDQSNPVQSLYQRYGFNVTEDKPPYRKMERTPKSG
jgi:ribosomal protein S18 acetylase RimI-like enzyme